MYQQGSVSIGSGMSSVSVTFSPVFDSTPALIIPVVANTSADPEKYLLTPTVVGKAASGFTVQLSAETNTNNYKLNWLAGDPEVVFQLVNALGVPIHTLPEHTAEFNDDDMFVVEAAGPLPVTKRLPWYRLRETFIKRVPVPTSRTSPGNDNDIAWDGEFVYTKHGGLWGRSEKDTTWG